MRANYDFSDAIKNPFAGKIKEKYTVTVHYDFTPSGDREEQPTLKKNSENARTRKQA